MVFDLHTVHGAVYCTALLHTGKSLSEALILGSTAHNRFFIDLPVQYMKTTSSEHVVYINCFLNVKTKTKN